MGLGDIFDEAFELYKGNFLFLLLVTIIVAVPLKVAVGFVQMRFLRDAHGLGGLLDGGVPDVTQIFAVFGSIAGTVALLAPLYAVGFGLQTTALASAASARYLGTPSTVWDAYRLPLRRIGPLALSALLYGMWFALGACVCYVGALLPLTLLAFTAHAFAVDGRQSWRFWEPLGRSRRLVQGQGGRVFGALCVMGIVYTILSIGIQLPVSFALHALVGAIPNGQALLGGQEGVRGASVEAQIIGEVGSGIAELIAAPFLMCVLSVLYFDLRVRKEAFDMELLARDLHYAVTPWVAPHLQSPARTAPRRPAAAKERPL